VGVTFKFVLNSVGNRLYGAICRIVNGHFFAIDPRDVHGLPVSLYMSAWRAVRVVGGRNVNLV
jgi:hypothetical protein